MPIFKVQAPDGSVMQIEGPADATDAELQRVAADSWKPGTPGLLPEAGRVVDKAVRRGLTGLPGLMGDAAVGLDKKLLENIPGLRMLRDKVFGPGPQNVQDDLKFGDVTKGLETAGGLLPPVSEPQTSSGKALANVGEAVVGTVAGGGSGPLRSKILTGLAGGAGGEAAARVTDDNPLARVAGGLAGSGIAGVAQAWKSNADDILRDSTKFVTGADWAKAKELGQTLEQEGVPHLKSQLLGPRSTLADAVAIGSTNPAARGKLVSGVESSADAAQAALNNRMSATLPFPVAERREALSDVQKAAQAALDARWNASNAKYKAQLPPEGSQYPKDFVEAMGNALEQLAKSDRFGPTTDGGKAILRLIDDLKLPGGKWDLSGVNPTILMKAQQAAKQSGQQLDPSTLAGAKFERELVTSQHQINNLIKDLNQKILRDDYKGLPIADVKKLMKDLTEPEFGAARASKTNYLRSDYDPVSKGLAGDLARMGGGVKPDRLTGNQQALSVVFPKDIPQPLAIRQLGKDMGSDQVAYLLREHLARSMENAASLKGSVGETAQAPFNFVQSTLGTNAQRKNFEAAIETAAAGQPNVNPVAVRVGFEKLLKAFETFKDLKIPDTLDRAALTQQAGKSVPGVIAAPNSRLGRYFWEKATARTYNQIADIVLSKDGLQKMQALAQTKDPEYLRQVAISTMMAGMAGENKE